MTPQAQPRAICLRFDRFEFDAHRGELRQRGGRPIALRPRAEALLRLFLAQPGRLVSREELTALLWPSTVVTDDSLVQCVGELRSALDDHGQRLVRTVRGRGYRWEALVERLPDDPANDAGDLRPDVDGAVSPAAGHSAPVATRAAPENRRPRTRGLALAAAIVVSTGGLALGFQSSRAPVHVDDEMASHNTVAVMPFMAAAGDAEVRALGDLITDAISAQFATRKGMRGVGRAATADYAAAPLERIASQLKANFLVTGQVARAGKDRVAADVQLISASGGAVIWSRHWDAAAENASARAELGQHVVNAVRNRSTSAKTLDDPSWTGESIALRQTVLGWRDLEQYQSLPDLRRARARFEDALRVDPESVIASNGLAVSYAMEQRDPHGALTPDQLSRFETVVEHTREIAPDDATALLIWGGMQIQRGRSDLAIPAIEKSIAIVPSYPNAYVLLAQAKLLSGQAAEVQALAEKAIERGAGDPKRISNAYLVAAEAALLLADYGKAASLVKHSIAEWPSNVDAHAVLAAIDALTGRNDEAATEMAEVRRRAPNATLVTYASRHRSDDPVYLAQSTRLYDGLQRAGLPSR
jgi:DNA-binding winged helix-turn-helix (wHTH) protein/TolB-like protein